MDNTYENADNTYENAANRYVTLNTRRRRDSVLLINKKGIHPTSAQATTQSHTLRRSSHRRRHSLMSSTVESCIVAPLLAGAWESLSHRYLTRQYAKRALLRCVRTLPGITWVSGASGH